MKKLPILATLLLIAGLLVTSAFTIHPIQSVNGTVTGYSPGSSLTVHTADGDIVYMLRSSTLMWGFEATSGIAVTGGNGTSSSTSSSSASASASPTAAASSGASATATPSSGSSGSTTSGATSGSGSVNGLATGARVTVFGQCFVSVSTRHTDFNATSKTNNGGASNMEKVCLALAVIVRAPGGNAVPATGGTSAPAATSTSAAPAAPSTTGTPTSMPPSGTATPTP